jgi:uncharacterized cupin superfamily protein
MAPSTKKNPEPQDLLVRADRARTQEESFRHPLNPDSELHGTTLSRLTGLVKCGVNVIRVPPGKESFVHHVHLVDEEWMYVLSGRGELRIGDRWFEVGPGDFAGFPPRTHAHHLRNRGAEDLVYLSGGETIDHGVADFPELGLRMTVVGNEATVFPLEAGRNLFGE